LISPSDGLVVLFGKIYIVFPSYLIIVGSSTILTGSALEGWNLYKILVA